MKKFYLLAALLCLYSTSLLSQSATSIHYWDFNTGATTTPASKWPSPINATSSLNAGVLTHNFNNTEDFGGTNIDAPGFTSVSGPAFCVVSNANNGNSLILNASTVGYQDIRFTYATRGTSTGFSTHTIDYSTDGTNYTNIATITGRTSTTFTLQTVDLSAVTAANNNSNFKIRITVSGATNTSGNNRFDNMRVTGVLATSNIATVAATSNGAENPSAPASFTISLNNPAPAGGVSLTYRLNGSAVRGSDYNDPANGSVTIPEGSSTAVVSLPVINDAVAEGTESINCTLLSASNSYNFSTTPATVTITDDEATTLQQFTFNGCTGTLSDGFTQFSSSGAELWSCTTFGLDGNGVQMNGFSGGANQVNEDWLISPALNLSATNVPLLSFYSRTKFAGQPLKVLVSTNYSGSGDPALATWTEINGRFPATHSDNWTVSNQINLSSFKQSSVYIAFQYVSNTVDGASRWTLDELSILDATAAPTPSITLNNRNLIDFRQVNFGSSSAAQSFKLWINDISSDITLTAPAGFEISKNGTVFTNAIIFTTAEALNTQLTAWVRLTPSSSNNVYTGLIDFNTTGLAQQALLLKGNSYPSSSTLNVVNWNIEWFGSAASGQGPVDDNLAQANAKTIMEYLDADVYGVAEIVDASRFASLVSSLAGGYSYVLAEFCSSGGTAAACASAQKLALIYKTSVLSNVTARPLMNNGVGSNAYNNWSSGRYPFLVTATVNKNGFSRVVNFIVLHAKALDDADSYNRRKAGAEELKDTLDAQFSSANVIILGDYNDDLDSSIVSGVSPRITPYDIIIKDSTDADSYRSLTLPLSRLSLNSTFENAEMIDHVVVSNEIANGYIANSSSLYNDIGTLAGIADFPNTTSDHYPVMTRFLMSGILPVRLTSFEVRKEKDKAILSWATSREVNSKEFIVERSADGSNFSPIGKITAAGNSADGRKYELTDHQPLKGANFYRLRMADQDNKFEFSKIVRVVFNEDFSFSVSPNPSRGIVNVYIENNINKAVLQLTDANGRMVKQLTIAPGVSRNIQFNISGQAKGLYLLKLITDTKVTTEKLVIE